MVPGELLDRLYSEPPDRFIPTRDEAVAAARRAGDRRGAEEIGKLRKPTVAAWLVNLVVRKRPELVDELLALGEALRSAQHDLRGEELRELSGQRRTAIGELVGQARILARESGRAGRDPLPLAEVEATLSAALSEPEVAEAVRAGTLTRAAGYAGFGETPKPRLRVIDGGRKDSGKDSGPKPVPEPDERVEAVREAARTRARAAQAELRAATEAERDAARVLADLTAQLEDVKARQAQAQVELRRARLRVKTAQRAVQRTGA